MSPVTLLRALRTYLQMKPHRSSRILPPEEPRDPFPLTELIIVALFVGLVIALLRVTP